MTPIELSAYAYKLGVDRCYALIENPSRYVPGTTVTGIGFIFSDNGCVHCSMTYTSSLNVRATVDVKLDCKPEPHRGGPMLNAPGEPTVYIIREDITVDGVTIVMYGNPSY